MTLPESAIQTPATLRSARHRTDVTHQTPNASVLSPGLDTSDTNFAHGFSPMMTTSNTGGMPHRSGLGDFDTWGASGF